jgi:phage terminase small subunit
MFNEHGSPKEITELDNTEAAAIGGFELYEDFQGTGESRKLVGYTKKFKLTDRLRALELYGKACGYYADRQELTGPDGHPVEAVSGIKVEFVNRSPAQ